MIPNTGRRQMFLSQDPDCCRCKKGSVCTFWWNLIRFFPFRKFCAEYWKNQLDIKTRYDMNSSPACFNEILHQVGEMCHRWNFSFLFYILKFFIAFIRSNFNWHCRQTALSDLAKSLRKEKKNVHKTFTNTTLNYAVRQREQDSDTFSYWLLFIFCSLDSTSPFALRILNVHFHPFTAFLMRNKFCNFFFD